MSAMYVMIALLSMSLLALLQWSYLLMFGKVGFLRAPTENSLMIKISDKYQGHRKQTQMLRKVYLIIGIYLWMQICLMVDCAIIGNVYSQA